MPLLFETGAAALAWRRISHLGLESYKAAQQLHEAHRFYKLRAAINRREIARIFNLLREHSIEPVLVKGWAIARHYAEPSARPCGDIDLCVRKEEHAKALSLLQSRKPILFHVDLHREFNSLDDRSFDELTSRSELVELEGEQIRVLSAEDHLRVLCFHFLREGGWRALWLCDIAAALESRPANFDWDLCMGRKRQRANWVACAIKLAHELIGAKIDDTPATVRDVKLPRWLVPSILKEWEVRSMSERHRTPTMTTALSRPLSMLKGLRHHWPTPVEATVTLGAPINEMPRLPLQVGNFLSRSTLMLARLPRMIRERRS